MRNLGKSYQQIEEQQSSFNFLQAARTHDPQTSHEAVEEFTKSGARLTHCERIIEAMEDLAAMDHHGPTGREIAQKAGMDYVAVMRRMNDLLGCGKVVKGAARICKTDGKTKMLTWWLT